MVSTHRWPAEWEPQSAVLLAWPHAGTDWAPRLAEVEGTYAALIAAIAAREGAVVCVPDPTVQQRAERLLRERCADPAQVRFVRIDYDDTWLRDSGPVTLVSESFVLLDFRFTGWGDKYGASRDDRLVQGLVEAGLFGGAVRERIDFALEGGAIDGDGDDTVLSTWRCLHERHPDRSRAEIEQVLRRSLRCERVLWLEHGYLEGDDTDAHIDTLVRFAAPDAIVYQACDDPGDPHHGELAAMTAELAALRTREGKPYRLFALPWPRPIRDGERRLAASYANFLIVNGAVLMPAYDDPADARAAQVLAQAFPGREIVPIPCRPLIWQNGSLHCITMQLPQGVLA